MNKDDNLIFKFAKQDFEVTDLIEYRRALIKLVTATKVCYARKDAAKMPVVSLEKYVRSRIKEGHCTALEFSDITVKFFTDRVISHRIVRHRLASFMQMSNNHYLKDVNVVIDTPKLLRSTNAWESATPDALTKVSELWFEAVVTAIENYNKALAIGVPSHLIASMLPQAIATEIVVKANLREWRHILKLRTAKGAQPYTRALFSKLLTYLKQVYPVIFEDIK